MKHIHYISAAIVFMLVSVSVKKKPADSAEMNVKPVEAKTNFDVKLGSVHINDFVDFGDSTEREKRLAEFYANRDNELAWFRRDKLDRNGRELIQMLETSDREGLSPDFYNLSQIKAELNEIEENSEATLYKLASVDLLLTNSYLDYASDIFSGRLDPNDFNIVWEGYHQEKDLTGYLENALENRKIAKSLIELRPEDNQYELLRNAYQRLLAEQEKGGWILPGEIPKLEENDSAKEVVLVKQRLAESGYLFETDPEYIGSALFDERLTLAVKSFQLDHGLETDGVIGKNTVRELNRPIEYRIAQIRLNLDRLRWLHDEIGNRDIVVNIPDFMLEYYENYNLKTKMGVVVGKTTNYTPALKDTITYLVFNPTWNVPRSIATEEMLPKIKADPSYLAQNNYKLVKGSYLSDDEINPQNVDWSEITAENFPYFIVQKPGNGNALGRVKFMLPNNHSIYLHDTPSDYLFDRNERDFSHGCVRLEKPFHLAEILLERQMSSQEVRKILASRETKAVILENPVAVHLIYRTAWVDDSGHLQFRKDIYGFDERLMTELGKVSQPLAKKESVPNLN